LSRHRLRARLERLERSGGTAPIRDGDCAPYFTIERQLAKSLRDDYERLDKLWRRDNIAGESGGPLSAAELEEMEKFRASMAERASKISCPADYTNSQ
jgi:hypothetical protein